MSREADPPKPQAEDLLQVQIMYSISYHRHLLGHMLSKSVCMGDLKSCTPFIILPKHSVPLSCLTSQNLTQFTPTNASLCTSAAPAPHHLALSCQVWGHGAVSVWDSLAAPAGHRAQLQCPHCPVGEPTVLMEPQTVRGDRRDRGHRGDRGAAGGPAAAVAGPAPQALPRLPL